MTDDQVAALMADLFALKWAAAVIAKCLALIVGFLVWGEIKETWTGKNPLF